VRLGPHEADVAPRLFGLGHKVHLAQMEAMAEMTGSSCLFILDSGFELAFV